MYTFAPCLAGYGRDNCTEINAFWMDFFRNAAVMRGRTRGAYES